MACRSGIVFPKDQYRPFSWVLTVRSALVRAARTPGLQLAQDVGVIGGQGEAAGVCHGIHPKDGRDGR